MEWVETTAKTLDEAREAALDQLGVALDDAEFDILEEPRPGLFGRMRGEARLRARVRPTQARPKQERRRKSRSDKGDKTEKAGKAGTDTPTRSKQAAPAASDDATPPAASSEPAAPANEPTSSNSRETR